MKIGFCMPTRETVHASFSFDLALCVAHTVRMGHEVGLYSTIGTLIADQRVSIAEEAIKEGCEWLMWLDSDMRFPRDSVERLLAHGKEIVGANYPVKENPPSPVARNYRDGFWFRKRTKPGDKGIEKITGLGFGVMLTKAIVFKDMDQPWFAIGYAARNKRFHGEDLYFCMRAADKGYETWVDHDLTREVRHIGAFEYSTDHIDAFAEQPGAEDLEGRPM